MKTDLRARINQALAGTLPPPRGNVLRTADLDAAKDMAQACARIFRDSIRHGEPLHAPSELLNPLP